ncbi:hypothetical protein N7520_009949 [Penicillium odoratum]|uniref:uncharacterized protein n=1 Tax=Penicillium odoratum TaxID=1167516 RepID=UPI0025486F21|nr:uncharacterized protein N7520_009949 [Penicillium odoratum]KAJ5753032.1 hypothetical protein N7520_009949 [Penicillium odoratum]
MDLLSVLPGFAIKPYAHILPSLERCTITTVDLITLDILEIAKRAHVPPADVRRLCVRVVEALHADLGFKTQETNLDSTEEEDPTSNTSPDVEVSPGPPNKLQPLRWDMISTLDPTMDALLGGGIPTGYVTEVTGESGSGKTQFLLSLLLAVQLAKPHGVQKRAIYISTEHLLATNRLSQLLESHPHLSTLPADQVPTLENVLSINAMDLETQDHILNYQLPIAITRYNVGLVVIDSITSNYRAEHAEHTPDAFAARATMLANLGQMLRNLAVEKKVAIVVANQVYDRFDPVETMEEDITTSGLLAPSPAGRESGAVSPIPPTRSDLLGPSTQSPYDAPSSSPAPQNLGEDDQIGSYQIGNSSRNPLMTLMSQERFFTGWGDSRYSTSSLKTPALGYNWSTQIACRIALKKEPRLVFMPDNTYPLSTPLEQMDRSEQEKVFDIKPGFATARQTHTRNATPESPEEPAQPPSPKNAELKGVSRSASPVISEPEQITTRIMKVVFAPWTAGSRELGDNEADTEESLRSWPRPKSETRFEIWKGGLRSIEAE